MKKLSDYLKTKKFSDYLPSENIRILHEEIKSCEEGEIDYTGLTTEPDKYSLRARANVRPNIINNLDGKFWNEEWERRSNDLGIKYDSHNSGLFIKRVDNILPPTIIDFKEKAMSLLKLHHKAANKYNQEIAEPYIESRKIIIMGVIDLDQFSTNFPNPVTNVFPSF